MSSLAAFGFVVCILMVGEVVGQNNDVCLTLPRNQVDVSSRGLQGSPGKRGPVGGIGPKGVQGPKGEPGDVESCGCKPGDVIELKEQVRRLIGSCFDGILYNNQCIRLLNTPETSLNFKQAQDACTGVNASLVDISSDAMYNQVYNYVYSKLKAAKGTSSFSERIWLASTFKPINNPNNEVTLSDGSKVRLTKWWSGFPYKGSFNTNHVNLLMGVNSNLGSRGKDIFNWLPTTSYTARPLCSYNI